MPFVSKAQGRKFFALEREGKLSEGEAEKWMHETPDFKSLPEHVGPHKPDAPPLPKTRLVKFPRYLSQR